MCTGRPPRALFKVHMLRMETPPVKAAAEQASSPGDPAESRARAARPLDRQDAIRAPSGSTGDLPGPLPKRGDTFTEKQLRKRLGLPLPRMGIPPREKPRILSSGIRASGTSSDIVLINDVHSGHGDAELGKRTRYGGAYRRGWPDLHLACAELPECRIWARQARCAPRRTVSKLRQGLYDGRNSRLCSRQPCLQAQACCLP